MSNAIPPLVRIEVHQRDKGCLGPRLGATDPCVGSLQLDHIREIRFVGDPLVKGIKGSRKPRSIASNLAVFCAHHHLNGFATSHRPAIRAYLARVNQEEERVA